MIHWQNLADRVLAVMEVKTTQQASAALRYVKLADRYARANYTANEHVCYLEYINNKRVKNEESN